MIKDNATTAIGTTLGSFNYQYCQYRLPCGYCEKLGRDCPKGYNPFEPTVTLVSNSLKVLPDTVTVGSDFATNSIKEEE